MIIGNSYHVFLLVDTIVIMWFTCYKKNTVLLYDLCSNQTDKNELVWFNSIGLTFLQKLRSYKKSYSPKYCRFLILLRQVLEIKWEK